MNLAQSTALVAYSSLMYSIRELAARAGLTQEQCLVTLRELASDITESSCEQFGALSENEEALFSDCLHLAQRIALAGDGSQSKDPEARLSSLMQSIALTDQAAKKSLWGYSLQPLTAQSIFPVTLKSQRTGAQQAYRKLWDAFVHALEAIPRSHRRNLSLWLDHLETALQIYTANVPAQQNKDTSNEESLYDVAKTQAALCTALWRWHQDRSEPPIVDLLNQDKELKFLLIQGDFFGIQDFIFTDGSKTQKASAKLLRGRSFYVSLLSELAALKVLEQLDLPGTSLLMNAAGKFLIVAPNTEAIHEKLQAVQAQLDQWFITNTLATGNIGLAATQASTYDLTHADQQHNLSHLTRRLFEALEVKKLQRFDLTKRTDIVFNPDYTLGVSAYDKRLPQTNRIAQDQIAIGERLVKRERILILNNTEQLHPSFNALQVPIFGYTIGFAGSEDENGRFGQLAKSGALRRCWDYSMPASLTESLWNGYARRNINGFVARFDDEYQSQEPRYQSVDTSFNPTSAIKSFAQLACEEREMDAKGQMIGQVALMALKGDIDNLGLIFQKGLLNPKRNRYPTLAKMATLSRQVNLFFTIYLPVLCATQFPQTYTVFAGGDDFFMIGPWLQTQRLASSLNEAFTRYVANEDIHFSCGMVMLKPDVPVRTVAAMAEEALSQAKGSGKNAVTCFGVSQSWQQCRKLACVEDFFRTASMHYEIGNAYFYSLFEIIRLAARTNDPLASIWRSRLYYKSIRMAESHHDSMIEQSIRNDFIPELIRLIEENGNALRIPLSNHFYKNRQS